MPHADTPRPLSRRLIHRGKKFDFEMVSIQSGGRTIDREIVRHPGAAVVVPILPSGDLVMIRNRRIALEQTLLEFPAGTLEPPEHPEACARRELIEETGFRADTLHPLGSFYTTPGLTDERMHAFAADGLHEVGQALEEDEQITVEILPPNRVFDLIDRGDLVDAKSMLALFLTRRRGLLKAH